MWTEFLIGFMGGIAATPHCLGMCGGFPLHLAKASQNKTAVFRQVLFLGGKTMTYIFLGALAAALGVVLLRDTPLKNSVSLIQYLAGIITILFGISMLGVRLPRIKALQGMAELGFIQSLFRGFLISPSPAAALSLGLGVGFFPCPLPMGMLAIAAGTRNVLSGIAIMAGVGLGTAPGLLAVGLFGVQLDRKVSRYGMRLAGVFILFIGLLMIGRTSGMIHASHPVNRAIPPCCQEH